ncbi:MAG: penicillin-binding protein activator LpoB [Phycisphaerales bacterium]|nr:penicillin-binding protein activator LpoB [Phycisphaerales bacterium]
MHTLLKTLPLTCVLLAATACNPAHRIETGGPESITSTSQIDMQDAQDAASKLLQSMIESGEFQAFARTHGRKPRLLFRDHAIVNDSSTRFQMPMLTAPIKEELLQSRLVLLDSTYKGVAGSAQDSEAAANARRNAIRDRDGSSDKRPDFSLTGSINELTNRAGSTRELNLRFTMTLTDWRESAAIWSKSVPISKSGDKATVGF